VTEAGDVTAFHRRKPLKVVAEHPSAALLALQLVFVLSYPYLADNAVSRAVIGVAQMAVVLTAVWAVRRTPALTTVAVTLGFPATIFTVLEALSPGSEWIVLVSAVLHAPFYFFVSYAMIRYLFHDTTVTRDELFATAAAFTVVAWGFTYVFAAAQVVFPGSFIGEAEGAQREWFELLYLSFSVLTSVGLSDVVPVLPQARSLVIIEMVAGVLYVALVVARLVALTAPRAGTSADPFRHPDERPPG
jgi:hypothetical protein